MHRQLWCVRAWGAGLSSHLPGAPVPLPQRINLKKSFALKLETNTTKASTATPGPHPEYESVSIREPHPSRAQ